MYILLSYLYEINTSKILHMCHFIKVIKNMFLGFYKQFFAILFFVIFFVSFSSEFHQQMVLSVTALWDFQWQCAFVTAPISSCLEGSSGSSGFLVAEASYIIYNPIYPPYLLYISICIMIRAKLNLESSFARLYSAGPNWLEQYEILCNHTIVYKTLHQE